MKNVSFQSGNQFRYRYAVLMIGLVIFGFWLRARNLGALSFIVDEGVETLAVQAILQHGVPRMDSGLVYLRFPIFLYMQAAFAYLGELNEFWIRLPSVVWGVASIVPTYLLGKQLFNRPIGVLSAIVITLSVWEIEISRYARPYIALQFFFLVSLICFYRGFMLDERKYKVWFLVSAFFTFTTHELSQVLITLFAIPLFSSAFTWKRKLQFGYWAVGTGALLLIQQKIAGFHLPENSSRSIPSEANTDPGGIIQQITGALGIPPINGPDMSYFFQAVQQNAMEVLALGLVAGVATAYLFLQLFQRGQDGKRVRVLLGFAMIWAAFAYQFGIVLILFVTYLALFARSRQIVQDRVLIGAIGAASVCFIGWFILLATSSQLLLVQIPLKFFDFPAIYKYLFRWLIRGWPIMTLFLLAGSVMLFVRYTSDRRDQVALFTLGALYVPALFASFFQSSFVAVYTLHLYPLIVLIFATVVWKASFRVWTYFGRSDLTAVRLAFFLGIPLVLVLSQDANPLAAWRVGARTYQSEKDPVRNVTNWRYYNDFHQDVEGPASFVKEHMEEGDKVAVIGPDHTTQLFHYYIGDVDYTLVSEDRVASFAISRDGEIVHYTTGAEFVVGLAGLKELLQTHSGNLWLLGDRRIIDENHPYHRDEAVRALVRDMAQNPDYVGRDGITFALDVEQQSLPKEMRQVGSGEEGP